MKQATSQVKLIECSRDAMQGWKTFIPTEQKAAYINQLLKVGFDTIDFGSFVSPKAIPQMADTKDLIPRLRLDGTSTKLLAIIANERGATEAAVFDEISYLGFPFSVSETFQQKNTNSSISESLKRVDAIQQICIQSGKKLVVYLSMGFGNPYGDDWNEEIVFNWAKKIAERRIEIISVADTVGLATASQVERITRFLVHELEEIEIGVHLHSTSINWKEKLDAAYFAGCRRFDGAMKGIGGCPMAGNDLVGNMDTENLVAYFDSSIHLNNNELLQSRKFADELFSK